MMPSSYIRGSSPASSASVGKNAKGAAGGGKASGKKASTPEGDATSAAARPARRPQQNDSDDEEEAYKHEEFNPWRVSEKKEVKFDDNIDVTTVRNERYMQRRFGAGVKDEVYILGGVGNKGDHDNMGGIFVEERQRHYHLRPPLFPPKFSLPFLA